MSRQAQAAGVLEKVPGSYSCPSEVDAHGRADAWNADGPGAVGCGDSQHGPAEVGDLAHAELVADGKARLQMCKVGLGAQGVGRVRPVGLGNRGVGIRYGGRGCVRIRQEGLNREPGQELVEGLPALVHQISWPGHDDRLLRVSKSRTLDKTGRAVVSRAGHFHDEVPGGIERRRLLIALTSLKAFDTARCEVRKTKILRFLLPGVRASLRGRLAIVERAESTIDHPVAGAALKPRTTVRWGPAVTTAAGWSYGRHLALITSRGLLSRWTDPVHWI